jgi:hypothetical protein
MCPRLEGLGGKGQAVPRVRTDMVLTALRGVMPKKGPGGGCPLGHTASQHSQTTTKNNSNNTHHHQSGHSHSALDLEDPLLGGWEGVERVDDEVSAGPKGDWPTGV